jgi:organic radical activating enzyme
MNNLRTNIYWQLSNHCIAECFYCPTSLRGGEYPEENKDYIAVVNRIADHYNNKLKRIIHWEFDGGEPLDLYNLTRILKIAKSANNSVALNTNGGNLWLDWFAIEPNVDKLILTYHDWQQYPLIKYILDIFQKNTKDIVVKIPIRPSHFDEDMDRAKMIEQNFGIIVSKMILYKNADPIGGMFDYKINQLLQLGYKEEDFKPKTYHQKLEENINQSPSYLGKLCNAGIEKLMISHNGYVNGSNCRNQLIGNIWLEGWIPPSHPQICNMMACMDWADQQITKFT